MYEEQVKRLRDKASKLDYDGWVDTAASLEEAADTIEELSKCSDIVYCKDCKHRFNYDICACRGDDWFCGYGERR